jgi:outer membrane lipopolysaccharide assembly protein LptE/RlpB
LLSVRRYGTFILLALLAGCGYQLRTTSVHGFSSLGLTQASEAPVMAGALRDELRRLGVSITMDSPDGYSVEFLDERSTRRTVATTNVIDAAEYELKLELDVVILKGETALVPTTTLVAERVYALDRTNLSGSAEEETLLMVEMRVQLSRDLLRRVEILAQESQL